MSSLWFSRRGMERERNGDVGLLLQRPSWLLAVVMDHCKDSNPHFGKQWCCALAALLQQSGAPSKDQLTEAMKDAWVAELKGGQRYRAAVTGLLLNHDTEEAFAVVAGDCRIGRFCLSEGSVQWLTPVHTTDKPFGKRVEEPLTHSHVMTRCLKARRFPRVEVVALPYHKTGWILATDGYWNASVNLDVWRRPPDGLPQQIDDQSCLLLDELLEPSLVRAGDDNFISL